MAGLRDNFGISVASPNMGRIVDEAQAAGMGSLRRGWESGRIGNELNPLYTEELEAGIANDQPRRSLLRNQIDALKQKQSMYAPEVSDLRQINGIGDAGSWAAGQVGQGAASMVDPMAVSAGLGVVGRVANAIPHPLARVVGGAAQVGQFAVPALMSKRQLTGEFIGEAEQDPELMARTSKQGLRDMAGNYGTIAAIPDSALPGIVGRQVSGLSRAGGAVARKAALGPGLSTLGEMGVEGLTEGAQAAGSQYARGVLNPDRDTSGDNWDIINNAAGGAVGAGPFAGAGSYAEAGHNRVGAGAEAVKGAVGSVVDMANTNPTVQAGVAKAKSIAERVRGSTMDMMADDDGKVSAAALIDNLKAGAQDLKSKGQAVLDEHSILNQIPPEGVELDAKWLAENDPKRAQLVADKLNGMPDDQDAQQYLDAIMGAQGDEAQHAAINDGAQFLVAKAPLGRAEERMNSLGENLGKIAGVVAPALGRGAVAVGKAALGFGKAVLGGAKDGMSKKNEQTNEAPAEESFGAWRDRNYGVKGVEAADSALAKGASYKKAVDFNQRAELAGSYAEDMAKRGTLKNKNAGVFAKHVAFSIADMIDTDLSKGGVEAKAIKLNRLTTDFHDIYGKNAAEVITQMGSILGKGASPVVEHMLTQLEQQQSAQGRAALVTERDMLAKQVVGLVDPAMQNTLMKQGVNLNTPSGRDHVLRIMEDFADKISSDPQARKALDGVLGAESVQNILTLLNGQPEKESPYGTSNQFDSQETRDGEKLAAKGSGPKVYGFHKAPNLRTNSERRDMFGAMDAPDSEGVVQRPQLFKQGEKLFGGRDAIEKKIEDVKAQLAGDPEYPDHDNHSVTAKSAHEVMKEAGMQPGKVLQLYRDYMRMAAKDEKLSEGERKYATQQARIAHGTILDAIQKKDADGKLQKHTFSVGPKDRAEIKQAAEAYFKERFLIVGEQLSNRDPSQISLPEMLDMHKEGAGLIERSRLTEEPKQTLADANVLMFKSGAVKGGEVAIPAGKLVNWVRKMRGSTEQSSAEDNDQSYSNKSKDDEYRNDVMEGIASLIGSGHVKGMPYKLNKFGAVESFAKGIPDSLRLATKTHGESVFADAKRREKYLTDLPEADPTKREALRARLESAKGAYADIVKGGASKEEVEAARHAVGAAKTALDEYADANSGEYESAVTKEQTRERSDETEGSIDDTVDDAPMSKREIRNALTRAEKVELNSKATHEERVAYIKSITKGMGIADAAEFLRDLKLTNANGAAFNPDAKTSKTGDRSKTPLDFFPKAEGVPDEFANQRWLSKQTGATTDASIGPEPKGTAASSAKFRAQKIGEAFLRDSAEGMDMIKMRIRSAMRPVYSADKTAVVGGVHYIAPVAAFINAEELAKANVDLPAKTIKAIQSKVANILLKGDVSKTEKVKIARLMLDGQEKVTDMNVDAVLGRYAEGAATGKPVTAKQETAAPEVANAGLPKGALTLSGGVKLPVTGGYTAKDQVKSDKATKFIGRGSSASSTAKYATAWGDRANTGSYSSNDRVFISAEGNRLGRLSPDADEIQKALDAGATIITDDATNRERSHNVGERQVVRQLMKGGYVEASPGTWLPRANKAVTLSGGSEGRKLNAQIGELDARYEVGNQLTGDAEWAVKNLRADGDAAGAARLENAVAKALGRSKDPATGELQERGLETLDVAYARSIAQRYNLHNTLSAINKYDQDFERRILTEVRSELVGNGHATLSGGRKLNAMAVGHQWMYHGTRAADEALVQADGSLLLKPSKNLGGKTFGVSFTHDPASAKDYATRIKGGGPKGFTYKGAKLLKIDRAALKNIEEETFGEWADYTGKDVVIPKGMYTIEPVVRDRYFLRDSHLYNNADYSFKDYRNDYGPGDYEYDTGADDADEMEQDYLNGLLDEDSGASEADKAEARKILAEYRTGPGEISPVSSSELLFHPGFWDESKRDASWHALLTESQQKLKRNAMTNHTSVVDEIVVYGKVWDIGDGTAVEATHAEKAYGDKTAVPEGSVYFELFTPDGDQRSGWLKSVDEVIQYAKQVGIKTTTPKRRQQATLSGGSEGRKLNAMAVDIHRSLGRDGFAATHDSPIKHEGKFDWRAHQGKGEGNASFGAGTYLSTSDGVHQSYKRDFTAMANEVDPRGEALEAKVRNLKDDGDLLNLTDDQIRANRRDLDKAREELAAYRKTQPKSPTYEVSVDIKPEQLLDWDRPLSEQSELVRKALDGELRWKNEKRWSGETSTNLVIGTTAFGKPIWGPDSNLAGKYLVASSPTDRYGDKFDTLEEAKKFVADEAKKGTLSGDYIYKGLVQRLGSQAKASDYLQSLGILGHKYAASGGKNKTHPNYVIYDDSRITTNYVHFNKQTDRTGGAYEGWKDGPSRVSTQAERDAAVAEAKKLFGDQVKVDFQDITGYSGEFIDATNVIVISTTAAAGTMNTLFHEAMHKFFKDFVKSNPKLQAVFESLINDPKHLQKLHDLLDGYPAAQAQLTSGEERLAYTYQFWKAGLLQVDTKAHTWLQKVGKFFRHVMGRVRDSERALELFQAFDNGKMSEPSAAGMVIAKALNRGSNALKVRRQVDGLIQGLAALTVPAAEILGNSLSPTARALSPMMFTNPGEESHGSKEIGMLNARRNVAQQYTNVSNRRFETMSEVDKNAVQKYLQSGADPATIPSKEQREAVKDIRHLLDRFHKYMTDSGMDIGKIDNYYPVVWNPYLLNSNRTEFINMLVTKYADKMGTGNPQKAAERIWQSLVNKEGVDAHLPVGREDGVLSPFFASQEQRTLPWLEAADREKYLDKNMPLTLTRYFSQGAHATEYFRRFGKNGIKLEKMLSQINSELSGVAKEMMKRGEIADEKARVKWVSRQMRDVSQSVGAMEGTLGKDVSPNMRTFNSWMTVYQNIRLLPMALFSSFVDPLALVARGAPFQAAYETFTYSMREVFRNWADAFKDMPPERVKDEWRQLAEHIGASEIAMFQHHVSDEYSSTYMTPGAKKINDKMFTFNGMEAWNRGSRIMATKWAVRFIEQHAGLPDKNHSARWLKELGLTPSMITMDDGKLVTSPQQLAVLKGITLDEARAQIAPIHDALNRWVEGAVLTPNAAQRPAWSSDPNYATAFHLKQFSYSFHQTILKRATNEFSHGNMAPLTALAMFIPTMIGADLMKGLIQGGGSLPPYMASMNAGDWVMHGAQRAGLSGIGVIGMDAATDWASLGGPAFEQIIDAARDGFGSKTVLNAAPLHSLYGQLATA